MRNETLIKEAKRILKELLSKCTESEQLLFKRMYAKGKLELPIDEVVDKMDTEKMDWAISQCENTLKNKVNGVS